MSEKRTHSDDRRNEDRRTDDRRKDSLSVEKERRGSNRNLGCSL